MFKESFKPEIRRRSCAQRNFFILIQRVLSKMPESRNFDKSGLPPGQSAIRQIPRWGVDHPTIGGPVPKIDIDKWILSVDGEVEKPLKIAWKDLLSMPKTQASGDFHCVEGWSVLDLIWEGVSFKEIAESAAPKETARFVSFECADGYLTSLPLPDLLEKEALLAYRLNGEFLKESTGAPLRLVVQDLYAYKSAMWLTRINFTRLEILGFWESRGYSNTAGVWKNDRFST